jgi:tRNA (guanine-N1)-methyltransferase
MSVPEVLINGNHKDIEIWQQQQSLQRTAERRSDLLPDSPAPQHKNTQTKT